MCPARWFWESEAGGHAAAHQSANLGQIVHALAHRVAVEELPADVDRLMAEVDAVWERLSFRTPWSRGREHDRVRAALERFVTWHRANPRSLVGTEQQFRTVVEVGGREVVLQGYADRLELDADGRVVVVDLKTSRSAPSNRSVLEHAQLGLYQLAVDHGAVDGLVEGEARSGGAELVQLGLVDDRPEAVVQPQPVQLEDAPERRALRAGIDRAAGVLREESFPAISGQHCRDCSFLSICPARSAGSVTR